MFVGLAPRSSPLIGNSFLTRRDRLLELACQLWRLQLIRKSFMKKLKLSRYSILTPSFHSFPAICGPPKYSEIRLNLGQAVQGVGTFAVPLLASQVFYSNTVDTDAGLKNVQGTYLDVPVSFLCLSFCSGLLRSPKSPMLTKRPWKVRLLTVTRTLVPSRSSITCSSAFGACSFMLEHKSPLLDTSSTSAKRLARFLLKAVSFSPRGSQVTT